MNDGERGGLLFSGRPVVEAVWLPHGMQQGAVKSIGDASMTGGSSLSDAPISIELVWLNRLCGESQVKVLTSAT